MKVSFPSIGIYTNIFKDIVEDLDQEVIEPRITRETIKLGVRNSPEMICYPYKIVLGTFIDCLERGAKKLLMFDSTGPCRFKHYHDVHRQILEDLGYDFEMIVLKKNIPKFFKKINPNISYLKSINLIKEFWRRIKELEKEHYYFNYKNINIGIIGELYTILEPKINYNIINKLKNMGVSVHISTKLSDFIIHNNFSFIMRKSKEEKESYNYLKAKIGGHGRQSIYHSLEYCRNGFDGIIHLEPLTCMPECVVEPLVDKICRENKVPIYRFPIDENQFEIGFNTRLETFINLIKRKKCISA